MNYKTLGRTNIAASEIILGGGAVGGIIFKDGLDAGLAAVTEALNRGINWVDSAPVYGGGKSEEYLGKIMKQLPQKPHVTTKVCFTPEQIAQKDFESVLMRSVENSLKTLCVDWVDVLQLHNQIDVDKGVKRDSVSSDDLFMRGGILDAFQKAKDCGYTANIGFTAIGRPDSLASAIDDGRFDMFQAYVNLLNPTALLAPAKQTDMLDFKQIIGRGIAKNMGIVAIRTFAAGVLAGVQNIPETNDPLVEGTFIALEYQRLAQLKQLLQLDDEQVYRLSLQLIYLSEELGVSALGFAEMAHMEKALHALEHIEEGRALFEQYKDAFVNGRLY